MLTATENEIMFDDALLIENSFGKGSTARNLSPDCDCSGYTEVQEDEDTAQIA